MILSAICTLLCLSLAVASCSSSDDPQHSGAETPSAARLLYGVLQKSGLSSPDLLFSYGEDEYAERFESMYHTELSAVADGAVAISTGMSADEITVIRPKDEGAADELVKILENHVSEEIAVYEKYSPEDTANLKNARIFKEGGFVILIVSPSGEALQKIIRDYIASPEDLPALPSDTTSENTASANTTAENTTKNDVTTPDITDTATEPPETSDTPPETDEPPVTDKETTGAGTDVPKPDTDHVYAYENELPEREPVGDDFFTDAVFVGDSRIDDLVYYLKPECAASFTHTSLSVTAVFTKNLVNTDSGTITIADALRNTDFSKCYLMFGLNELGWPNGNIFIKDYVKIIDLIREINPDCDIYIMNIYPVTAKYSESHPDAGNKQIKKRNDMIAEMAKEQGVKLLNSAAALCNDDGVLPAGVASDGVHGNKSTCQKLFDYMHTHY